MRTHEDSQLPSDALCRLYLEYFWPCDHWHSGRYSGEKTGTGTQKRPTVSNLSVRSVFAPSFLGLLVAAALAGAQPPSVIDAVHRAVSELVQRPFCVAHAASGVARTSVNPSGTERCVTHTRVLESRLDAQL
jgi:hypothetical protein